MYGMGDKERTSEIERDELFILDGNRAEAHVLFLPRRTQYG